MLVKKGCMVLGCHSPAMFHDYRLRGGSGGNFSVPTTRTNYELTREQIALESPTPTRAGSSPRTCCAPIEQAGRRAASCTAAGRCSTISPASLASPALCDIATAAETGTLDEQHAYCVIARWIQIEQRKTRSSRRSRAWST